MFTVPDGGMSIHRRQRWKTSSNVKAGRGLEYAKEQLAWSTSKELQLKGLNIGHMTTNHNSAIILQQRHIKITHMPSKTFWLSFPFLSSIRSSLGKARNLILKGNIRQKRAKVLLIYFQNCRLSAGGKERPNFFHST